MTPVDIDRLRHFVATGSVNGSGMINELLSCSSTVSNRESVKGARAGEANAQAVFQSDRALTEGMTNSARLRAELRGLFNKNAHYRVALESTLVTLGRTVDDFKSAMKADEIVAGYAASIPNFDVFITLRVLRDQDRDRVVEHNDIRDLDWLSVVVPYGNIVVSEQYWGRKVLANGLAAKYGTVLITNLQELPAHLKELGCID